MELVAATTSATVVVPALSPAFETQLDGAYRCREKLVSTFRKRMLAALQASDVSTREQFQPYKTQYLQLAAPHILVDEYLVRLVPYQSTTKLSKHLGDLRHLAQMQMNREWAAVNTLLFGMVSLLVYV